MLVVDTDVLAIHHIFTWDKRYDINKTFLESFDKLGVTIHSLMELCSPVSRAFDPSKGFSLFKAYFESRRWNILFPSMPSGWEEFIDVLFPYINKRQMSYGDALIAWTLDENADMIEAFITWNTKDFKGKIKVPVYMPDEWMKQASLS